MPKANAPQAVVLLSGGLDSSFNFYKALLDMKVVLVITFSYGQRAVEQEIAAAARLALDAGVRHEVVDLPWFKSFTQSSLLSNSDVPSGDEIGIDDLEKSKASAKSVWVPNRNGIFLNIAAGFAEGMGAEYIIPGFNAEEAATFPDNSEGFLKTIDASLAFSTATGVKTHCYSTGMDKTQIVAEGIRLDLPFDELWPCYVDETVWCGKCESCQRFSRALSANRLSFTDLRG